MPNLKLAFRTLFKSPFVTVIAALSLALGIGANAAIFSLFNSMLLRPLPVPDASRLINLGAPGPKPGSTSCNDSGDCEAVFSYPMYRDLESKQTVLTGLAGHRIFSTNVAVHGQTLNTEAAMVSGSYFPTLGLRPALGRLLTPADDQTIGGHFVAVLSYRFWQTALGGDSAIVNQTISISGHPMTVIGIAPEGFDGTTVGARPKVYVPLSMRGQMQAGFRAFDNRRSYWIYVFGKRKPDVAVDRARVALNTIYRPIIQTVDAPLQKGMSKETLVRFNAKELTVTEGRSGQSDVQKEAKTPLLLLLTVTAIVLLIACANIANLLLARAANRSMEMAVRLSLGATRGQLLTQLLTESILLALIGGVASIVVAHWTLGVMAAMLPTDASLSLDFTLNRGAFLFTAAMSIATGLLFGLFPAMHSTRPELITALRSGAGNLSSTRGAARFRATLVTTQIALSTALLIGAGLFIKSLQNVSHVDLGLSLDAVSTFAVSPALSGYDSVRSKALYARIEEELAATPGISSVSASRIPLLANSNSSSSVSVEGFTKGPDTDADASYNELGTGYFQTVGIQRLAGRDFTTSDAIGTPKVAIVNMAFARKFGLLGSDGRGNPTDIVGKRMSTGSDTLDMLIVGVVRNAKYSDVKDSTPAVFFTPYRQSSRVGSLNFYVRSTLGAEQILPQVPKLIKRLDPMLPVENLKTMPQQVRENVFLDRMISSLSAAFALLATLLAAVGLYGVLAYSVAQRTGEIGIRLALGADGHRVRMMVLRQVGVMTCIGAAIGIVAAFFLGRGAGSLLYEIKGYDPVVFVISTLLLIAVSLAAGFVPAMRASRIDPIRALRYE